MIITALYAALATLVLQSLAMTLPRKRYRAKVGLGDGNNEELRRAVRAHGNAAETIPIVLILMGLAESLAANPWLLHGMGVALLAGRILHPIGLYRSSGASLPRFLGMILTWGATLTGAVLCLVLAAEQL